MRLGDTLVTGAALLLGAGGLVFCLATVAYMRPVQSARSTTCVSNLKQLQTAALMYAQDYDGLLPSAAVWREAVEPYHKMDRLWNCPEDVRESRARVGSYALSRHLDGVDSNRILDPAKVVVHFDANVAMRNAVSTGKDFAPRHPTARHEPGGTVSYLDGHVKREVAPDQLRVQPPKLQPVSASRRTQQ